MAFAFGPGCEPTPRLVLPHDPENTTPLHPHAPTHPRAYPPRPHPPTPPSPMPPHPLTSVTSSVEISTSSTQLPTCGEIWGDVGRCGEMWGDVVR